MALFIDIFKTYRLLKHVGVRFCKIRNHFDKVKPYSSSIFINILVFYKHINTITIRMWKSGQQKFKKRIFLHLLFSLNIFLISIIINMRGKLIKFCENGSHDFLRRMQFGSFPRGFRSISETAKVVLLDSRIQNYLRCLQPTHNIFVKMR